MEKRLDASWLSEEGREISEDTLLKMYEVHSEDQISHLDSHYKYRNYYTAILAALLSIFVGGMLQFYKEPFAPALLVLLLCIGVFSWLGKRTTDRYYKRFLESITILAKIENALGLDHSIKTKKSTFDDVLWINDEQLLPDRWVRDRRGRYKKSEEFISDRMNMGDSRNARWTFCIFGIISIILAVLSIFMFLQVHGFLN